MGKIIEAEKPVTEQDRLAQIAEKFGKIPAGFTKSSEIIAAGYLTQEEFDLLPQCPRSSEMTGPLSWPKIGGRKTYPLSGCLNQAEKNMYYEYKRGHKPSGSSTGSYSAKKVTPEVKKAVADIRKYLQDNKASAEILKAFEEVVPKWEESAFHKLFGTDLVADVKEPVTVLWLMFRGPNGERHQNVHMKPEDIPAAMTEGYMPAMTKAQVDELLEKCRTEGIPVDTLVE